MRASLSDFDSLVCREQVCALRAHSPNCCPYSVIFCNHSVPRGAHLMIESICATATVQILFFLRGRHGDGLGKSYQVKTKYFCTVIKNGRL